MLAFWQNNSLIQILDEQDYPMTIPFRGVRPRLDEPIQG